eukprot:g13105.t1
MSTCTAERIVVPCRGDVQIYQVVKGKIPGNLKAALSEPLSEEDVKHIFREVGLQTAQPVPPGQRPKVLWSFGPPAAGKSTLAHRRAEELFGSEGSVCVDGDEIRDRHPAFRDSNHQFQSIEYYDTTGAPMQLEFSSFERLTETEFRRSSWRTEDGRRESLLKKLVQDERPEVEERSMSTRSRQSWWSWLWQRPLMTRAWAKTNCGLPAW